MLKKTTFSLLIVLLSMLIVVTVDAFLLKNSHIDSSATLVSIPSPEKQILAIDAKHPLITILKLSNSNPQQAQQALDDWSKALARKPELIELIYQLWIQRNVAKSHEQWESVAQYDHALFELATQQQITWLESKLYTERALKALRQDAYHEGLVNIKKAIALAEKDQADFILLEAYNTAGILHNALNQLKQSQLYFSKGLELGSKYPNNEYNGRFNNNLGLLFVHLEQWDRATEYLLKAEQFYRTPGQLMENRLTVIYFNLSYVHIELNNVDKATEYYEKAMEYINDDTSRYLHIVSFKAKGRVDLLAGNAVDAEQSALQCLGDSDISQYPKQMGICLYLRSLALFDQGKVNDAVKVLSESIGVFKQISHHRWLIRSNLLLAEIFEASGEYKQALTVYKKYHGEERKQIINEFHALETAFEVRTIAKERDLLGVQNQLKDLEGQVTGDRFKILLLWLAVVFIVTLWFVSRSVIDRRQNRRLHDLSYLDPLTGGGNRRLYYRELHKPEVLDKEQRYRLVMVDIDWFKRINDSYGHEVGDEVLADVALKLKAQIESDELFIRWGGEEFLLLVKDRPDFRMCSQSLVSAINRSPLNLSQQSLAVTVSVGASGPCNLDQLRMESAAFVLADKCLYKAKEQGRNQYVVAEDLLY
ncbi:MAG TPA: diguanylate cyclase [Vibrio sp.]|nr:diguanylate cyclase [Vibrio sp.]